MTIFKKHPSLDNIFMVNTFLIKARNKKTKKVIGIGTAFCVAIFKEEMLLLTAGHNVDFIFDLEKPSYNSVPSSPFKFEPQEIKNHEIFVLLRDKQNKLHECKLNVLCANLNRDPDVASLWFQKPKENCIPIKWGINTEPPEIGTKVGIFGFNFCNFKDNILDTRIYVQTGLVTNVLQGEDISSRQNCIGIKTNIPLSAGLSGSPLVDIKTMRVLGIASRDLSDSSIEKIGKGDSLFTSILHSLGMLLPMNPNQKNNHFSFLKNLNLKSYIEEKCLFHLVACGIIDDISECHKKVKLIKLTECGNTVLFEWRNKKPLFD